MPKRALVLIDLQNDYFPGGKWALSGMEAAADNAAKVLAAAPAARSVAVRLTADVAFPCRGPTPGRPALPRRGAGLFCLAVQHVSGDAARAGPQADEPCSPLNVR